MAELVVGAGAATGFLLLVRYTRAHAITLTWWHWGLTFLGFLYWIFVLEVVVAFFREGTPQGAAVMGTLLGFVGVVWMVVLGRTVFSRQAGGNGGQAPEVEGGTYA